MKPMLDYSCHTVKQFEEIKPFTKDAKTNKYINESHHSIFKPIEDKDLQEVIESHREECDLYSILKTVVATGDASLLNQREGTYGDISDIPDNTADLIARANANDAIIADLRKQLADLDAAIKAANVPAADVAVTNDGGADDGNR